MASDVGFGNYITTIRPWLISQHSIMTEGWFNDTFCEGVESGSVSKSLINQRLSLRDLMFVASRIKVRLLLREYSFRPLYLYV